MKNVMGSSQRAFCRWEAKRTLWAEIKKKQIMEALAVLRLWRKDDPSDYIPFEYSSPLLSTQRRKIVPLQFGEDQSTFFVHNNFKSYSYGC
jgi:hypothetical protein